MLSQLRWVGLAFAALLVPATALAQADAGSQLYFWYPATAPGTSVSTTAQLTVINYTSSGFNFTLTDITPDAGLVSNSQHLGANAVSSVGTGNGTQQLKPGHFYKLTSDQRVNAFIGDDTGSRVYGTFFVPSNEDASRRVGRSFNFWAPTMSSGTHAYVYAYEPGTVQVAGGTLSPALSHTFTAAGQVWQLPTCTLQGKCNATNLLDQATSYGVTSTGLVAVAQVANDGVGTVPSSGGFDVGSSQSFVVNGAYGGALALFGYANNTPYQVFDITDGGSSLLTSGTLNLGSTLYLDGKNNPPGSLNGRELRVLAGGMGIGVWQGDTQDDVSGNTCFKQLGDGGLNPLADTLGCSGDDITVSVGQITASGTTIVFNSRSLGAVVFSAVSGTQVNVSGDFTASVTLNADQTLAIPPFKRVVLTSTNPVVVQTAGGDALDDWGKYLPQVPGVGGAPAAPVITTPANGAAVSTPPLAVSGTAPAGSVVALFMNGLPVGQASAGASGTWTVNVTLPVDGSYTFTATDALNGLGSLPSNAVTVTLDRSAPATPTITSPASGSTVDSRTPTIAGTAEPGSTVSIAVNGVTYTVTASASGTYSFTLPASLADGSYTATVTSTDAAGNTSGSAQVGFTVDATPPAPPTLSQPSSSGQTYLTTTPVISGTAEPGSMVTVTMVDSQGQTVTLTTTAAADGSWSVQGGTALAAGNVTVSATAKDAAGNTSAATSSTILVATGTAALSSSTYGGAYNSDTPTLTGTAPPGSTVVVTVDGVSYTTTADSSGSWSLTVPAGALTDGSHTVNVQATDAAGDSTAVSSAATFTTSSAPTVIVYPTDGSTVRTDTPVITGTAAPGTTIAVNVDGTTVTTTVDASGNWAVAVPAGAIADGTHTVTVTDYGSSGAAGSTASTTFTTDTTAPVVSIASPSNGAVLSTSAVVVSGSGQPGGTLVLTLTANGTTTSYPAVAVDPAGNWSVTIPQSLANATYTASATETNGGRVGSASSVFTVAAAGPGAPTITGPTSATDSSSGLAVTGTAAPGSSVTVTLTDANGNSTTLGPVTAASDGSYSVPIPGTLADGSYTLDVTATDSAGNSASTGTTFTVDTVAPAAPTVLSPTSSGTASGAPVFEGTAEPGSLVILTVTDAAGNTFVVTATADSSGQWSATLPSGTTLAAGTATVTATATDAAGNTSVASAPVSFTVDASQPLPPTSSGPADGSVVGTSTPTFTGTAAPGSTVTVTVVDNGVTSTFTGTADASGNYSITASSPLPDGTVSYSVTDTSSTGVTSAPTASETFSIDTSAPAAPTFVNPASGSTQDPGALLISGFAEPGATVTVSIDGQVVGTATADASGYWTFTETHPPAAGTYDVTATATDSAGNTSASSSATLTISPTAVAPTITGPTDGSTTNTALPLISGAGTPGDVVRIFIDGVLVGTTVVDASGHWSYLPPATLSDGAHSVSADESGSDGAVSPASSIVRFYVDTTAPQAPELTGPLSGSSAGSSTTVTGTAESGSTVTIFVNGTAVATVTVDAGGTFSVTVPLPAGADTITATATDAAGNSSPASNPVSVTGAGGSSSGSTSSGSTGTTATSASSSGSAGSSSTTSSGGSSGTTASTSSGASSGTTATTSGGSGGSTGSTGTTGATSSGGSSSGSTVAPSTTAGGSGSGGASGSTGASRSAKAGGCGCSANSGSGADLALFGLALAALRRRRRA